MNTLLKALLIVCITILFPVNNLLAQEVWEELAEQLINDEEEGAFQWDNDFEELSELKENPINLNAATKEQLERFPFLSAQIIENILYYLYKYGPMMTVNELCLIEDIDWQTIQYLQPFVCVKQVDKQEYKPTLRQVLKYGKQELSTRVDIPVYTKAGYKQHTQAELEKNPNKQYLGGRYYHNLRYSFRYRDKIYLGLTAEKDAGEPFFAGRNKKGYDFYSPYLLIRNIGKIKALAIGNYRLSYGYGLVINTDFGMGKTAMLSTLRNKSRGICKHSSTDEYNYFQGTAISYKLSKRWTADAFYSYRQMDGIVDNRFITSLKKDGYHRLWREFEKKNSLVNQVIGNNLNYNGKYCELGLTMVYNVFNRQLNPDSKPYNKYYPRGRDFYNIGTDYKFFWKRLCLLGETAIDKCGTIATMNMLSYAPKGATQFIVMNRYYDARYQSIYARSLGEGSAVQNESGIYIGLETRLLKYIRMTCYSDFFYFPWKRYRVSETGTNGFDGLLQLSYSPTYQLAMFIRYRYKNKKKDFTGTDKMKQTIPYIQQKCRYQLSYTLKDKLLLKTIVDYAQVHYQSQSASNGFLVSQSASYKWGTLPLQLDVSGAWFNTDDYESRLTIYEKGLLYAFSMPSFYYKGTRLAVNARYELDEHIILQAKYGTTHYRNRDKISSGLEQVDGSTKSDLYLQLRLKF
ncbi:helix-hairpin-helix domain-containing protein [Phocaeicola sp.]